jgi:tetratricopeptide (TPR) repeat protein
MQLTVLMRAAMTGRRELVALLLEFGADVAARSGGGGGGAGGGGGGRGSSKGGDTAADIARQQGFEEIVVMLDSHFDMAARRTTGVFAYALDAAPPPGASSSSSSSVSSSSSASSSAPATPEQALKDARSHMDAGRYEAAIAIASTALAVPSTSKDHRISLLLLRADALSRLEQHEAARASYNEALQAQADAQTLAALVGHAKCALMAGDASSLREATVDLELAMRMQRTTQAKVKGKGAAATAATAASKELQSLLSEAQTKLEQLDPSYRRRVPMAEQTHYDVLQIKKDADDRTLRAAYRTLSLAYHEDKYSSWADAAVVARVRAKSARINEAYAVLSDGTRRLFYDLQLDAGVRHSESIDVDLS